MDKKRLLPGQLRDTISAYLRDDGRGRNISDICDHVESVLGPVSRSSVRSSLNLQATFVRVGRGLYCFRPTKE